MKIAVFGTHRFEKYSFLKANSDHRHALVFLERTLNRETAELAKGFAGICCFVNDRLCAEVLEILKSEGVRLVALRSAGYNNVDLAAAERLDIAIVRVPAYSPHGVAEHAVALLLALDRKICKSFNRVRELDFSLDGLVGFDLFGKTVGIVGIGKIGSVMARIMKGFGCEVLGFDPFPNSELAERNTVRYVSLPELYRSSDIISLHLPLLPETHHLINADSLSQMKRGVYLINTGRGALIDAKSLIAALKSGHVGAAGLDVYEEEDGVFFENLSDQVLQDDILARLLSFPNVLVTSHQAFLTAEALANIASTTLQNISDFENSRTLVNQVMAPRETKRAARS